MLGQAYLLYELMKKGEQYLHGGNHYTVMSHQMIISLGTVSIQDKLEDIYAAAGMHKHWYL